MHLCAKGLPQWNKNWHCSSERLWYDRWLQVLELRPDFVQIITCESAFPIPFPLTQDASHHALLYPCFHHGWLAGWLADTRTQGNDYGESSYIYDPTRPSQVVPGADKYVHDLHPHSAFRAVLPYFIAAYKSGLDKVNPPEEDCAIAWYRTTPADCGHDGGTSVELHNLPPPGGLVMSRMRAET